MAMDEKELSDALAGFAAMQAVAETYASRASSRFFVSSA